MGLVRTLLPLPRAAARLAPQLGGPLLGAALMRCLTPRWVLLRPPSPTRRLAEAEEAVAVYRALVEAASPRPQHRGLLARALAQHAGALLLFGRYEEALTALDASQAVPDARRPPGLRASVPHLRAQAQFELGRLDEALDSARDSVAAYRALLPVPGERAPARLSGALRTYALVLGALGRTEESVAVYEEGAGVLRAMSLLTTGSVPVVRARVLSELTSGLRHLGRYEEALTVGREAREATGSALVWTLPDTVRPLRVRLLLDLARCHAATGDLLTARTTVGEAVTEARALADRDRAAGEQWLIATLGLLADVLGELEEEDEELGIRQELVNLCAAQAAEDPRVHGPRLAEHLEWLADCHRAAGDLRSAVDVTERSVAAYRRAAEYEPAAYEPELARVLANLSLRRSNDGDGEGAVSAAREAVALTRRLAESDWQAYHPLTGHRLHVLGRALRRSGAHTAAVACYEESESILDDAREGDAEATRHASSLAAARSGLAVALEEAARSHLSAGRFAEAVADLRSLLALTGRTDRTDVHAGCVTAFAEARAEHGEPLVRAWTRTTGEDFPTFVYRRPASSDL
ncbi:tetratricopeptide repeat protein [Streptomyces sp. ME02-8801-2C]|uniref:tetratricopeptide repeat protein n=1 Tax=Streptomyces sp. ME02-8801-2C TaxID=3028680 RepID=UPI0029A75C3D|nr:tetratricopeptide repeat protein [Streptomyces sp. ME02-8801-2C]MDX3455468.1 tetratricopeptide repeat protein [Streptomyces sp. ME02-8801-2C]